MTPRVFTVEQANILIPTLDEILEQIAAKKAAAQVHYGKIKLLDTMWGAEIKKASNPDHEDFQQHLDKYSAIAHDLEALVQRQITDRGLRFPYGGLEHGLIDFPTTFEGRWVLLCWQKGEDQVNYWHELDGGYAGRQEILAEHVIYMGGEEDSPDDSALGLGD